MMNKFIKKKSRLLKIIAIFALLLCVVVYACQDEFGEPFDAQENARAIEYAKSWYNMNKPSDLAFRSSNGKVEIRMKPEWKNAFSKKNGKYETVESDLLTFGMFHFVHPKCMEKYNETGDMKYLRSYSRIVFRTDRKTNETVGFLMTQVPDLKFLEDTKFKPFKKSHYLDRDSKFGGWFLFHNLDGSFANGWVYENGKITGRINYFDIDSVDFSFRTLQCYEEMWYLNMWECPYWYTGGEDGYQYYCSLISSTYIGSTYFCEDDGTGEGGIDGGGSGGDYSSTSVAPNATKIFRNSNMTLQNWVVLENMISKIMNDCLGLALYNGLDLALGNGTLAILFSNNAEGFNYGSGPGSGSISLDMSGESNRLFHEMWHAYQAYQETYSSYSSSTLNQEFESWYAQYLYVSKLPEYVPGSTWHDWYTYSDRGRAVKQFEGYIDDK